MILVTGGTGLVGSHLLYELTKGNKPVKAIYRNEKKLSIVKKVFSYYNENPDELYNKIDWVQADILDIPLLTEAFKDVTYVYHCAAFVSLEPDKYHLLRKTNIEGTANIVNLSIANNIKKLCYVSSIAAIGTTNNNQDIDEDTHWNPEADNGIYGITKYGAEIEVWRGTQEGLNSVIVNPGVIIGPGIWCYGSGNIFKKVAKGLTHYTTGVIGYVDVFDVVNSMTRLMESNIKNQRFILISENWTYKYFIDCIANSLHVKPPTKKAGPLILSIGWKLDWLYCKLTGKRRSLSKQLASTLESKSIYSNDKIKSTLNFKFKPVEKSIKEVSKIYLNEHK
ncbi:NAD-dependent epimerase/dehydratase family protein [Formosa maritima]|uniref:NAD-dependent epimerase/dehydratase family protein n=1 Tax=Formosa maritima TaxID=2592046 RepID=A0A5D0G260_9FLAO|nr:NAD-dependent epimerase/dehydratase family protein [Formosa maritima]TYA53016.1 NAD-dependent epimerase/dehydratase family protein [Formosa maritima]